jgi:hypothetical protein
MSLHLSRRLPFGGLLLAFALCCGAAVPAVSQAAPCDTPVTNPIACENSLPGAPESDWKVEGNGDDDIQGFATQMSVNKGDAISFKIKSTTVNYTIGIYRLGYYGGNGARLIQGNLAPTGPAAQPACQVTASTGLIDCGNWSVSRTWTVPSTAVSGVYIAHLQLSTGGDSQIMFVVRDDASTSPVLFKTNDSTWQAYNLYGGNSLYRCETVCPPGDPLGYHSAFKVSYNRPFTTEQDSPPSAFFNGAEYPMIRFLERNGYNTSYIASADPGRAPSLLLNHKVILSSGHDEYWSANDRSAVEAARAAGVNLAFFTGNEVFWKTRWEPSTAGTATANRTLVAYKDTHFEAQQDPVEWTGTWKDPRFTSGAARPTPENALTGQSFIANAGTADIMVPAAYKSLRLWRNTAATSLAAGQSLRLGASTLGYEWDEDVDNGFRPAGQFQLSSTTVSGAELFTDYGSTTTIGTATHHLVSYRAASGALVFGAGTVQWSWGLDDSNPLGTAPDRNMQQATVNLLADMDAQPSTLMAGITAATKSTDTTKPTSTLTSPPATVADGTLVTLTGTAADTGGGVVAGVEVSTDGGTTWHPATTGTTSWTYKWVAHGAPSTTIKTRAVDDSGNLQVAGAGAPVSITCPCSVFGPSVTPPQIDSGDASPVELGVKFKSDVYGTVTGMRFYKAAANTGSHTGSLWTSTGTRLAQATFTSESASGWQTVTFPQPVEVQPGTTYVASYYAPNGHYSATADWLYPAPAPGPSGGATPDAGPLHLLTNTGTTQNGVYLGSAGFPTNSFRATNYWVDIVFSQTPTPGTPTNVTATAGGTTSANVSWTAPSGGGAPTSYIITPRINGVAQTPKTITGSPPLTSTTVTGLTTGTAYTFTVAASNPSGTGPASAASNSVTPLTAVVPSAPTGVDARPATQRALVSWTAPSSSGDSALTGYTVTPFIGATAQTPTTVSPSATSATITDLTNGVAYTFTVKATNGVGSSPASAATSAVTPQSTILDFATPTTVDGADTNAVELGVKFTASVNGSVTGIRFYKSALNTGTHSGSLWTSTGTRLAQATFTNETASGWQHVTFATPVAITAGTTYVASYYAPAGHYSSSTFDNAGVTNGPLKAVPNATSPNGVYIYGAASAFPSNTFNQTNYGVDVMFALTLPGQVTNASAVTAGKSSATVSWTAPATGGQPSSYIVTPRINGVAQTPTTVTGSPLPTSATIGGLTTGTTYTFTVAAANANGAGPASAASNAVTPTASVVPTAPTGVTAQPGTSSARVDWTVPSGDGDSPITGYKITPFIGATAQTPITSGASATSATITGLSNGTAYTFTVKATNAVGDSPASTATSAVTPRFTIFDFATPATSDAADPGAVEVGTKFTAANGGTITGVRFYKSTLNTGTHTGSLWSATGTRLAQVTFANESASGWQSATFASPVAVTAGTTYVVSYFAPSGHYSTSANAFASSVTNGPLTALANATSPNGVFAYGAASGFPSGSFNATNYWVDALFANSAPPGAPTGVTATAGQASATVSWTAPASGSPTSYTVTPRIGGVAQTAKTITGSPPATSTTVTGLTPGTAYTFTVTAGNAGGDGPASAASNSVTPTGSSAPGVPTGVAAVADSISAMVNWTAPASNGGSAITGYTVTPFVGAAAQTATTFDASSTNRRITGLTNGTSYTFTVKATNAVGSSAASAATNAVIPKRSIFELATPPTTDSGDAGAVNLGVKFNADSAGTITGVRFYKAATNTGTHVGSLWSSTGTLLAQATFANETASGWQTATFATPVAITAGTTYIASYLAPSGHYAVTGAAFSSAGIDNAPLHALLAPLGANGVYAYAGSTLFPSNSYNASNYWVDVLYAGS